jgi:hypothetical protein
MSISQTFPRIITAALLLATGGCNAPATSVDCDARASTRITGTIQSGPTSAAVSSDLLVKGTAKHADGLAIRSIEVGGVQAKNTGFNFDTWSATIPISALTSLVDTTLDGSAGLKQGTAKVDATATDPCGSVSIGSFTVTVDLAPAVQVIRLAVKVSPPGDKKYLPADGATPASVVITGNPQAAGAAVTVKATLGSFKGLDGNGQIFLTGDGKKDATAQVLYYSSTAGQAVVTATAKGIVSDPIVVKVAGAPALLPSKATIKAGQTIQVSIVTDGEVTSCWSTASAGVKVSSGGVDLTSASKPKDSDTDGYPDLTIAVDKALSKATTLSVTCKDSYNQVGGGTYDIEL